MWIMESEYYLTEEKMNNKKLLFMKWKNVYLWIPCLFLRNLGLVAVADEYTGILALVTNRLMEGLQFGLDLAWFVHYSHSMPDEKAFLVVVAVVHLQRKKIACIIFWSQIRSDLLQNIL